MRWREKSDAFRPIALGFRHLLFLAVFLQGTSRYLRIAVEVGPYERQQ